MRLRLRFGFLFQGAALFESLSVYDNVAFGPRGQGTAETYWALVITANPAQQLQVVATLSPRGLEPLLAENLQQVKKQLAAPPSDAMNTPATAGAIAEKSREWKRSER